MRTARVQDNVDYLRHLEADLIRAERAVVLLRNLVDAFPRWDGPSLTAARRYLADLDAGDIADGMV